MVESKHTILHTQSTQRNTGHGEMKRKQYQAEQWEQIFSTSVDNEPGSTMQNACMLSSLLLRHKEERIISIITYIQIVFQK